MLLVFIQSSRLVRVADWKWKDWYNDHVTGDAAEVDLSMSCSSQVIKNRHQPGENRPLQNVEELLRLSAALL